ncbi:serine/threonine-protein phosphatase 6 regulatory ankyrin repeat subunit C [Salvia hispanica]|uniref:serine/threonine-protein phosphatase 6 regulatory ankyrin repeat subunit C n=1 Tax=Salvia hispanica TaxID=49212 RepID=UPI002009B4D0|nr:serine/threonine-protein phosphatase 6 regulatory ankyrin repeat subunit C [Salvia hispanica]
MMVLRHGGGGSGGFLAAKQVVPLNHDAQVSHRLLQSSLCNDLRSVHQCLADPFVDVNYVGAVCLKMRNTGVVLSEESPSQVRVCYEEFRTDATPLFVAVTNGNSALVRQLLSVGADVNLQLFRGYATAAAAREGHYEILEILLKAGASQPACEEALLEVSIHGHSQLVGLLMASDLIRPHVAVHALVTACSRGFVEVVDTLLKCGVDANATDRVLLQSCKPSLHTNADCTALVAAVVSRQISVVWLLLKAGVRTDVKVHLGAWLWDLASGEEFRVGAGLAEPYPITWCAVEYFEATGSILEMLLQCISPDAPHFGRTLIHHAILCDNQEAVNALVKYGACIETSVMTTQQTQFRPIHMASRLGSSTILRTLIDSGCDVNSTTESGETAVMICAAYMQEECLQALAKAGADFGLVNLAGQSAASIARSNRWYVSFQQVLLDVIRSGSMPTSTNKSVFSPLLFVAESGDFVSLKAVMGQADIELDEQDDRGFSAVMIAAAQGHVDAFRLLVYAGADVKLCNKSGETAITLSKLNKQSDLFEKVMLEFALEKGNRIAGGFFALHYAARRGDSDAVKLLKSKGYDINAADGEGYTPLMLAAREGNGKMCQLLISSGADIGMKNAKGETALSIAKKLHNEAEDVILDAVACKVVTDGSRLRKHTKGGKGVPHTKLVAMVGATGVLRWGKSSCRNVICREAEVGPSLSFGRNRRRKGDGDETGIFRVRTTKNKEVHFVCEGGVEVAELWVRGIRLLTGDAIFGK